MRPIRVYPRACGGTSIGMVTSKPRYGLSPRVRGNLFRWCEEVTEWRSIPARAGEPHPDPEIVDLFEVYPRACGGTGYVRPFVAYGVGLSPRVRGNLRSARCRARDSGSIPARAGEPVGAQ